MSRLSADLYYRCRSTLLKCSELESDRSLRAIFVTAELGPFQNGLPQAANKAERVDVVLAYLLEKRLNDGRAILPLFLTALRDKYPKEDALHQELAQVAEAVRVELTSTSAAASVPSAPVLPTAPSPAAIATPVEPVSPEAGLETALLTGQNQVARVEKLQFSQSDQVRYYLVPLASTGLGFLTGLLGNLLAGWVQQGLLNNTFTLSRILSIVFFTIAGLVAGVLLERLTYPVKVNKTWYWGFVIVVMLTFTAGVILAWQNILQEPPKPPTVYYVVDATEKMAPFFEELLTQVQVTTTGMPAKTKVGLRVYGGLLSGITGCRDTKQLLKLAEYEEDIAAKLNSVLSSIRPSGNGSLTVAVLDTIFDDLAEYEGPVKVVIITSGIDTQCELPESGILQSRAGDIKSDTDILIVSIGDLAERDKQALESYAAAFRGNHWNIKTVADLPPVIKSVSNYGSSYLIKNPPLTPTP